MTDQTKEGPTVAEKAQKKRIVREAKALENLRYGDFRALRDVLTRHDPQLMEQLDTALS